MSNDLVQTFHFYVGAGDAALVCWLKPLPKPSATIEYRLHRAVLIDGGPGIGTKRMAKDSLSGIGTFLNETLPNKFDCSDPANKKDKTQKARLDAIIITHWDVDHWRGIKGMMTRDIQVTQQAQGGSKATTLSFCKYDANGPCTVLYLPYIKDEKHWMDSSCASNFVQVTGSNMGKAVLKVDNKTYEDLYQVRFDWQDLVGCNIFQNERPKTLQPKDDAEIPIAVSCLEKLVDSHKANDKADTKTSNGGKGKIVGIGPGDPCLLVIRAHRRGYVGKPSNPSSATAVLPAEAAPQSGILPIEIIPDERRPGNLAFARNSASVVCVLVWRSAQTNMISLHHYLGGDVVEEEEQKCVDWIMTGRNANGTQKRRTGKFPTDFLKVSHHGAYNSTPFGLFDNLDPRYYVVSTGIAHGHPRPELLVWLQAWRKGEMAGAAGGSGPSSPDRTRRLYSTRYPYYMLALEKNQKYYKHSQPTPDNFLVSTNLNVVAFQKELKDRWRTGLTTDDPITRMAHFQRIHQGDRDLEFRTFEFMVDRSLEAWEEVADPDGFGKTYNIPSSKLTRYSLCRQYIVFTAHPTERREPLATSSDMVLTHCPIGKDELERTHYPIRVSDLKKLRGNKYWPADKCPAPAVPSSSVLTLSAAATDDADHDEDDEDDEDEEGDDDDDDDDNAVQTSNAAMPLAVTTLDDDSDTAYQPPGDYATSSPAVTKAATMHLLIASTVPPTTLPPEYSFEQWSGSRPLDWLLRNLHNMSLAVQPVGNGPDMELASGTDADELFLWLESAVGATTIKLTRMTPPDSDPVPWSNLVINANILGSDLTFSSAPDCMMQAFGQFQPSIVTSDGWYAATNSLIVALDVTSLPSRTINAKDILDFSGVRGAAIDIVAGLLTSSLALQSSSGHRQAIWFNADQNYATSMRLSFSIDVSNFNSWLKDLGFGSAISVTKADLVLKHRMSYAGVEQPIRQSTSDCVISMWLGADLSSSLNFVMVIEDGMIRLMARPSESHRTVGAIIDWISENLGAHGDIKGALDTFDNWIGGSGVLKDLELTRVEILISDSSIVGICVDFLWTISNLGIKPTDGEVVEFLLSLQYDCVQTTFSFEGSLFDPLDKKPPEKVYDPEYEDIFDVVQPSTASLTHATSLDVRQIFSSQNIIKIPDSIDPMISEARVEVSSSGITITGDMFGADPSLQGAEACFSFGDLCVFASWSEGNQQLYLETTVELESSAYADQPASFEASIDYNDKDWTLTAQIDALHLGSLANFFPKEDRDAAMGLLKHINISTMVLTYNYATSETDNSVKEGSFSFLGSVAIDELELDLEFCRPKAASASLTDDDTNPDLSSWSFTAEASLTKDSPQTNFLQLLCTVSNDPDLINKIPSFFDFDITGDGNSVTLWLDKIAPATDGQTAMFMAMLEVKIDDLVFHLIQMKPGTDGGVKRIITATVNGLPWDSIPDIPLVGKLQPPFDELRFVYVHDDGGVGLLNTDIDIIDQVPSCAGLIAKKDPKDALQYCPGSHFIVFDSTGQTGGNMGIVLSYDFAKPKQQSGSKSEDGLRDENPDDDPNDDPNDDPEASDAPAIGKLGKSQGFLTIANLGLAVSGGDLHIILDAIFAMGPINFSLLGFEVIISLKDINLRSLSLPNLNPRFKLAGMAIGMDDSPISLAGIFDDKSTDTPTGHVTKYIGGVVLGFDPYSFIAVGSYSETTIVGQSPYKSVFVFAQLAGPLVELEFAEIKDVTMGLGYNSVLRLPAISEVQSFPFISMDPDTEGDIVAQLTDLEGGTNPWIADKDGPIWVAAGMGVKAFQVLDIKAVAVLEFNPFVTIGLVAKATVSLPSTGDSESVSSDGALLYAELGLVSAVDFHAGSMITYANLMPTSFILDPSCHLTGGFALCYWFGDNPHTGDWVFTVGGYHAAFVKPSHYPDVERLGISWDMGGGLTITGQSYFAITPKVCMAGAVLRVSWEAGPLSAYFDANADFLVVFQPFYFTGHVGVSVGVRFTLDLWFVTLHISVDIGAGLDIWGPPFGGTVYVDFYVFGFSISFGSGRQDSPGILLPAFWNLLLQQPAAPQDTLKASGSNDHTLVVTSGRFEGDVKPDAASAPSTPWRVRAEGFAFVVQTKFAVSDCNVVNGTVSSPGQTFKSASSIYAKPMHVRAGKGEGVQSPVTITIKPVGPDPINGYFTCSPIIKRVPAAIWGPYESENDPANCGNSNADLLQGDTDLTVDQVMSISVKAPDPYLSQDTIQPFDVARAMSADINPPTQSGESTDPALPAAPTSSLPAWAPSPWSVDQGLADDLSKLGAAWSTFTDADIMDVARAIGGAMGWPVIPDVKQPSQLLNDLGSLYMAAPVLSAG